MEKPFVIFHLLFGPAFSIQAFGHWWVTQQQIDVTRAHKNKIFDSYMFGAHLTLKNYKKIRDLKIPTMRSRFSADYEYHIELHDSDLRATAFCYFDTIMDIAPNSMASIEVSEVREELAEILWGRN